MGLGGGASIEQFEQASLAVGLADAASGNRETRGGVLHRVSAPCSAVGCRGGVLQLADYGGAPGLAGYVVCQTLPEVRKKKSGKEMKRKSSDEMRSC